MKKVSFIGLMAVILASPCVADAAYSARQFQAEVLKGLDIIEAQSNANVIPDDAPGALGRDVYRTVDAMDDVTDIAMFVPTSMYFRAGAGLNLGFATDSARIGDDKSEKYKSSGSYTTQMGIGWNLSSYVRTEVDWQNIAFRFHDLTNYGATYNTLGTTLYFDFARRYVQNGDITRRRHFVPFMGIGIGTGVYEFEGSHGAKGLFLAAPRGTLGFNVMLNDLIGIDIMYQYQMIIGHGFGWDVRDGGVNNISNVMALFRVNF